MRSLVGGFWKHFPVLVCVCKCFVLFLFCFFWGVLCLSLCFGARFYLGFLSWSIWFLGRRLGVGSKILICNFCNCVCVVDSIVVLS